MKNFHKGIRRLCTVILGLVFFAAGILKLMDPVGARLVVDEYFKFFHAGWMEFASMPVAVGMALFEALTGAALLAGVWRKWVALVTCVITLGFTLLTLILVIFNPEMDCGCFGEIVHLSHFQTFLKNIFLCILCAGAFLPVRDFGGTRVSKIVAFGIAAVSVLAFSIYSLKALPLVDFTEFAPGVSLVNEEEDAVPAEHEYAVVYEKDGEERSFTLSDLPDSTWTFVRVDQPEGGPSTVAGQAPLLFVSDAAGDYHNEILSQGRVMVLSIYDSDRYKRMDKAEKFLEDAAGAGFTAFALSREYIPELDSYTSDFKKVITLNRSNGGVTYIDNGEIIRKWPASALPDSGELSETAASNPLDLMVRRNSGGRIAFEGFLIYSLAILLIL